MDEPSAQPGTGEPDAGWRAWGTLLLLMLLFTSSFVDRTVISLLIGPIRGDLQISDTEVSLLSGLAFALLYTTLGVPFGWLADWRSRRLLIAAGAATWSLMTAMCGLAQSFWQLFAARMGVGVGEASLSPAAYSLISDTFPRRQMARAMGVYNMGNSIGSGLALIFAGALIALIEDLPPLSMPIVGQLKSWQTVFILVALPGLLLAGLMLLVTEPPRRGTAIAEGGKAQADFGATLSYLWRRRAVYGGIFLSLSLLSIVNFSYFAWIPTHFIRSYGWAAADVGQRFGAAVLVFGTTGALLGGVLADGLLQKGIRAAYLRVALIASLGIWPLGVAAPLMPDGWWSLALFCGWVLLGASLSVSVGSLQLITPNQFRGQATALLFVCSAVTGYGLGPTAVAMITDFVFGREEALRYSMAIVSAAATPAAALILWRTQRPYADELAIRDAIDATVSEQVSSDQLLRPGDAPVRS